MIFFDFVFIFVNFFAWVIFMFFFDDIDDTVLPDKRKLILTHASKTEFFFVLEDYFSIFM